MVDKNMIVKVTNRTSASVGYTIPDLGITRFYEKNETKEVTAEELYKLSYQTGGSWLIKNCLKVSNVDLIREIIGEVEPEYFYTQKEVRQLLLSGTLDELLDCLDFAPKGVIELIKDESVKLEINDLAKREAIQKATGFNVSNAILVNKQSQKEQTAPAPTRRVNLTPSTPTRRIANTIKN